jgi:hypothetical protein
VALGVCVTCVWPDVRNLEHPEVGCDHAGLITRLALVPSAVNAVRARQDRTPKLPRNCGPTPAGRPDSISAADGECLAGRATRQRLLGDEKAVDHYSRIGTVGMSCASAPQPLAAQITLYPRHRSKS